MRIAGGLAFLSGQLGVQSGDIVDGGIAAETRQCFVNLAAALSRGRIAIRGARRTGCHRGNPLTTDVHFITTGGTIDKEYSVVGELIIGSPMDAELMSLARTSLDLSFVEACRKDSLDLTEAERASIRVCVNEAPEGVYIAMSGRVIPVDRASKHTALGVFQASERVS